MSLTISPLSTSWQPPKTPIVLAGSRDWDEWLEIIKTVSMAARIWEFVDPSIASDKLQVLREPIRPVPGDIRAPGVPGGRVYYSELTVDEREEYADLQRQYREDSDKFERRDSALLALPVRIQETVSRANLFYTFHCETAYQMLVKLKARFSPSDEARKEQLIIRYQKAQRPPKGKNIEAWLANFENVVDECRTLGIADTAGARSVWDFVDAAAELEPQFCAYWRMELRQKEGVSGHNFHDIVNTFRNCRRENTAFGP